VISLSNPYSFLVASDSLLMSTTVGAKVQLVQLRQRVEACALLVRRHARGRLEVDDRIAARPERRALIGGRQEAGGPDLRPADRAATVVVQDDEAWQPRAFRPEPVVQPRAEGRIARSNLPRLHLEMGQRVIVGSAVDRTQECDLVDVCGDVREQLRHVRA
jgi:hypothetical protein